MEVPPYVAIAVMTLLTVVGQYLWPNRAKRIYRALAAQRRTRVREARGGVRLTGRVRRTGELLQAPLSGRPCVAYEVCVVGPNPHHRGNEGMSGSHRLVEQQLIRPFLVADESGEAHVETSGPFLLALVYDRSGATGWLSPYPGKHGALALLLESAGYPCTNWLGSWHRFSYAEGVLEEGELVSVSGDIAPELDPMGDRPALRSPPERLVLRGTEAVPLLISDARAAHGAS